MNVIRLLMRSAMLQPDIILPKIPDLREYPHNLVIGIPDYSSQSTSRTVEKWLFPKDTKNYKHSDTVLDTQCTTIAL